MVREWLGEGKMTNGSEAADSVKEHLWWRAALMSFNSGECAAGIT